MKLKVVRNAVWRLLAACTTRGDCELLSFLEGLEGALRTDGDRMLVLFGRVSREGPPRRVEVSHKIRGPIWEFIQGDIRVLYFYDAGKIIVCSHGIVKDRQKISEADIRRAEVAHKQYFDAKRRGIIEEIDDEEEP